MVAINSSHLTDEAKKEFSTTFLESKPFPHLVIDEFLSPEDAEELFDKLLKESFYGKRSDLFSLKQTENLNESKSEAMKKLCSFLSGEFKKFMSEITEQKYGSNVDVHGTLYQDTDYLLPHDDQLEGRRLAYLIYLTDVPTENGGELHLYDNKNGKPTDIVKSISPQHNRLAIFLVSETSFHQVEEVIESDRLAIGGWLHDA
jgi:Rps23 Pro-64 3,4-dihydroxylase Tpa1-like proline 4-hydroxylase